jgi:predicted transglutaminase-like cysteine proteinase
MRKFALLLFSILPAFSTSNASSEPQRTARAQIQPPFMRVHGSAAPPFGFVQFCERSPTECASHGSREPHFTIAASRLSELDEINRLVNARIAPATDMELYGVLEHWTIPTTSGDCEDYALLKRQILIKKGWPPGALLMTVVRDERGDGHAVLTARTSQGDYILDNKVPDIKLWHQTGYRFVMRQSYVDPRLWMSLTPDTTDRSAAATSQPARRRGSLD